MFFIYVNKATENTTISESYLVKCSCTITI